MIMEEQRYYSVVIPIYNSEVFISELSDRIITTMQTIGRSFEIILVDDCSKDKSWQQIKRAKSFYGDVIKGVRLSRNFGQHNATLCGIDVAKGKFIITIDDDLQFKPEDISLLIKKHSETCAHVVYGIPVKRTGSLIRQLLTFIYRFLSRMNSEDSIADGSSFRLMDQEIAKKIVDHARNFSFIDEFIVWHTSDIDFVSVKKEFQKRKNSGYTPYKLYILIRDLVLISSVTPLRFIAFLGTVIVIVNFLWGGYLIYKRLFHSIEVEGYTSLIVVVLLSTGIIMFSIAVIAEYLSKSIKMIYKQPAYSISEEL